MISELISFIKTRAGKYSITIAIPSGSFLDIRYDNAKELQELLHCLSTELQHTSIDELIKAMEQEGQVVVDTAVRKPAESFSDLLANCDRRLVLELIDRYVNRDIKWQIVEAYNEAIQPPMPELRGELVAMKDGIAQVKILDPMPNVTGSFRVVVDGGLAGADGVVLGG